MFDYNFQLISEATNILFDDNIYFIEELLTGKRVLFTTEGQSNKVLLNQVSDLTGNYIDVINNVPTLKNSTLPKESIFDGILIHDKFYPNGIIYAGGLQAEKLQEEHGKLKLVIFDILKYKGVDLRELPLYERKIYLENCFNDNSKNENTFLISMISKNIKSFSEFINKYNGFGVVLKNKDSIYSGIQDNNFLVLKNKNNPKNKNITMTEDWFKIYKSIKNEINRTFDFNRYLAVNDLANKDNERILLSE